MRAALDQLHKRYHFWTAGVVTFVLFQTRWTVGILSKPYAVRAGSFIKVRLMQVETIDEKPAIVRRIRLSASSAWAF